MIDAPIHQSSHALLEIVVQTANQRPGRVDCHTPEPISVVFTEPGE